LQPNTPGLDKVVEKILKMSQMDPWLFVTVNLARLAAKKPANMTSQAAMAQLAAGLSTLALDFVQLADLHHQTHRMVAFYKLGSELYEVSLRSHVGWNDLGRETLYKSSASCMLSVFLSEGSFHMPYTSG
jgi:hypothetical protein